MSYLVVNRAIHLQRARLVVAVKKTLTKNYKVWRKGGTTLKKLITLKVESMIGLWSIRHRL